MSEEVGAARPVLETPYERIGGEVAVRSLVECFYGHMNRDPEAKTIRAMHAEDLQGAKDKLFKFLSGWLGGPNLYIEEFGHPRLRMRHLPFSIGMEERDQWMNCMAASLEEVVSDTLFRKRLLDSFAQTANHMINRFDTPQS